MTQAVSTARTRTWGAACSLRSCSKQGRCHLKRPKLLLFCQGSAYYAEIHSRYDAAKGINEPSADALAKQTAGCYCPRGP